jgi:hypothetical protein
MTHIRTMGRTHMRCIPVTLLLACLLAACTAEEPPADQGTVPGASTAPQPGAEPAPGAAQVQPPSTAVATPVIADAPGTTLESLPSSRELEVTVEGQTELRPATLFKSPQGYAIYVLPQLVMTQEEPCCDLAYAGVDDGFFMRIERIDPGVDIATLRGDMELALSSVGAAQDVAPGDIATTGFGTPGSAQPELFMRARGDGVSLLMLVARIDGGRYRVTLHLPHREAAEGIEPSLWAMLGSLRTTGPRPSR